MAYDSGMLFPSMYIDYTYICEFVYCTSYSSKFSLKVYVSL